VSLKVNKAIATGSIFITNHLQTESEEEEKKQSKKKKPKQTDAGFLHACTRVSHRKTHPHFSGTFTLPDSPLPPSCVGVLAAGQGAGQAQGQTLSALRDATELVAHRDPSATDAPSSDRTTHNVSVQGQGSRGKNPHSQEKDSRAFGLQSKWEFRGSFVGSRTRKRISAGWSTLLGTRGSSAASPLLPRPGERIPCRTGCFRRQRTCRTGLCYQWSHPGS